MALARLEDLSAATITYNTIQFGNTAVLYQSVPPEYHFSGEFVWDDSRRTIKGVRYTLYVSTVFHESSEVNMAQNMRNARKKLSEPGKALKIVGLGTAFDTISDGAATNIDSDWGPKPLFIECSPIGFLAWQCQWAVSFFVHECSSAVQSPLAFAAFNFSTTWANDFEGLCTRSISGYAEISVKRLGKVPQYVADQVRDSIKVIVPDGFRRIQNVWQENEDKSRLDFTVVDELLPGESLPIGCIRATGDLTYASQGPGFNRASVTLSMQLRTSPSFSRGLAGVIFLAAAKTKQDQMAASAQGKKAIVVPTNIFISNGKFDRARDTTASISWIVTKCIGDLMTAAGIWSAVVPGNYQQWRTSVENLWDNRGAFRLRGVSIGSVASEGAVIDYCDNVTSVTIGATPPNPSPSAEQFPNFSFTCPDIPEDGGWVAHDLRVRIVRKENLTLHRKAVEYMPQDGYTVGGPSQGSDKTPLGGPSYSQSNDATKHDVEHHGLPELYVLVQFRGLRIKHKPMLPQLKTIGGVPVTLVEQAQDGPRLAFDALCPVWFIRGYRLYRVNGYISEVNAVGDETSCSTPGTSQDY